MDLGKYICLSEREIDGSGLGSFGIVGIESPAPVTFAYVFSLKIDLITKRDSCIYSVLNLAGNVDIVFISTLTAACTVLAFAAVRVLC
jgi:hypothetical protein